jgi:hypothetical protein
MVIENPEELYTELELVEECAFSVGWLTRLKT